MRGEKDDGVKRIKDKWPRYSRIREVQSFVKGIKGEGERGIEVSGGGGSSKERGG